MTHWQPLKQHNLPPEGIMVETKIDDANGIRNEQELCRFGNLMFTDTDMTCYVYCTPTHWRLK